MCYHLLNPANLPLHPVEKSALDRAVTDYVRKQGFRGSKTEIDRSFLHMDRTVKYFSNAAKQLHEIREQVQAQLRLEEERIFEEEKRQAIAAAMAEAEALAQAEGGSVGGTAGEGEAQAGATEGSQPQEAAVDAFPLQ
jgi:hypothetical protein